MFLLRKIAKCLRKVTILCNQKTENYDLFMCFFLKKNSNGHRGVLYWVVGMRLNLFSTDCIDWLVNEAIKV